MVEEPDERIVHVRICGGDGEVTPCPYPEVCIADEGAAFIKIGIKLQSVKEENQPRLCVGGAERSGAAMRCYLILARPQSRRSLSRGQLIAHTI